MCSWFAGNLLYAADSTSSASRGGKRNETIPVRESPIKSVVKSQSSRRSMCFACRYRNTWLAHDVSAPYWWSFLLVLKKNRFSDAKCMLQWACMCSAVVMSVQVVCFILGFFNVHHTAVIGLTHYYNITMPEVWD